MAVQIGPKIGIEGEKEYRQQIQQIIQQTKTLDSAMKATAAAWTKNTSQMSKNRAVAQNLAQQIELQKEKLAAMNKMLDESKEKFGENAAATLKWQQAVNDATANLNTMENQLKKLGKAGSMSDFSIQMADMGKKLQNMGDKLSSIGQKMTTSITLPIAAAGAAAVKFASDLEESTSKVEVVFGDMSASVKEFAESALNSYGLATSTAMQMAGTFGSMATSMGLSQKQAAAMSISLTQLAADMSSFYNVSTEVAQTSLQGIFTGETEALKKFGIVMTQTNLEKFAEDQGKVYSKMTEAEKVMTRYAFVMEATRDAQGDFARTSDGTANSIRVFQESLKELAATFGEQILPIITPVIQALTRLIQKFANLPAPIQKAIVVIGLIVAVIGPVIMVIGGLVSAIGTIVSAVPALIAAMGAASASLAAFSAAAGPVILAIVAIAAAIGVLAGIGYLIYENWDQISASAERMGDAIRGAVNKVLAVNDSLKNSVNGAVQEVISAFASLPGKIIDALGNAVQAIKDAFAQMIANAKKSGADFVTGFIDGIKSKVQGIIDQVKKIAKTIEEYLGFSCPDKGPLSKYETWMPDFMKGLAQGIYQNKNIVTKAMDSLSKDMVLPLDANASMNVALAGADGSSSSAVFGGMTTNVYVDHINDLQDLIRIQNQAQQRYRMGAR